MSSTKAGRPGGRPAVELRGDWLAPARPGGRRVDGLLRGLGRGRRLLGGVAPVNLVLSNIGNVIHWPYIVNLPLGPIWFLHSFYTLVTALMLFWYLRYRHTAGVQSPLEAHGATLPVDRSRGRG